MKDGASMQEFLNWVTDEKFYQFVHKFRRGDVGKYSRKLSVSKEDVLSVSSLDIPKETVLVDKNGKERVVYTLPPVQAMFCSLYAEYLSESKSEYVHSRVVSYKKGVSVGKVCRSLSKQVEGRSFVKLDIRKYFDSVSPSKLLELLEVLEVPQHLVQLFTRNKVINRDGVEEERFLGLIQGNPLASFLANALLHNFDRYMTMKHSVYFRYSDDIIFSKNTDNDLEVVGQWLGSFGLEINETKLNFYEDQVEFLGLIVEQNKVLASPKYMKDFRQTLKLTGHEKKNRSVEKYLSRISSVLAGSWIFTTMYGCRLEYLFGSVTSSHQFYELDNLIYSNIQYLRTGSRNSNVACKKGLTLKAIKEEYDYSLERAYSLYKQSEILSRAYLISFTREMAKEVQDTPLGEILDSSRREFNSYSEIVRYMKNGQSVVVPWNKVYDDSGFLSDPEILEPYIKNLSIHKQQNTSVVIGKVNRLERHFRFSLDYDYKLFLISVAINSEPEVNGFKALRDTEGKYVAAIYQSKEKCKPNNSD